MYMYMTHYLYADIHMKHHIYTDRDLRSYMYMYVYVYIYIMHRTYGCFGLSFEFLCGGGLSQLLLVDVCRFWVCQSLECVLF